MATLSIPDQAIRQRALQADASFLVQAPAGSGKTELLTQRLLTLLATVPVPEAIIAITFTRKAASQMRQRVIKALQYAQNQPAPQAPHAQQTYYLAKTALQRDAARHWQLINNPQRLNITTIDALCSSITQRMPIVSGLGATASIAENTQSMYQAAVSLLLQDLTSQQRWQPSLMVLLKHVDNRFDTLETLLVDMLAKRDQWCDVVHNARNHRALKTALQAAFLHVTQVYLHRVRSHFPQVKLGLLHELLYFSQQTVPPADPLNKVADMSTSIDDNLHFWQAAAQLLLTKSDTNPKFRRSIDKRAGFPDPRKVKDLETKQAAKTHKENIKALLLELQAIAGLERVLIDIRRVPPPTFPTPQWQVLQALLDLLPVLVNYLKDVFRQHGVVDFIEVALSALHALTDSNDRSDTISALHYPLQHLLVDEFQDTSQLQFRLLEQLTHGWQPGDGRTLFFVGDPMQSIYRFRQADVSLFLHTKQVGIGHMRLNFLQLQVNFRCRQPIIDWLNNVFPTVFPVEDDVVNGAISYAPSIAMAGRQSSTSGVDWHFDRQQLVAAIQTIRQQKPDDTLAILVRSRKHLEVILPLLQKHHIPYQAIETGTLATQHVIQDLLSLTFALDNTADDLSWLAILRAPWAGICLPELSLIRHYRPQSVLQNLQQITEITGISPQTIAITQRILPTLQWALDHKDRTILSEHVYQTWLKLSGPACLSEPQALAHAMDYFKLLRTVTQQARYLDRTALTQQLSQLKATVTSSDHNPIQVMTIHKSKGLEFDTVIVPALDRINQQSDHPILMWEPYRLPDGTQDILMAPIHGSQDKSDKMYAFLCHREKQKQAFEMQRLLYVAVTRAKQRLILTADMLWDPASETYKQPRLSSLLALLWHDASQHLNPPINTPETIRQAAAPSHPLLQQYPAITAATQSRLAESTPHQLGIDNTASHIEPITADLSPQPIGEVATQSVIGTVIHRYLADMTHNRPAYSSARLRALRSNIHIVLQQAGIADPSALHQASDKVLSALHNVLNDPQGQWVLADQQQARSEYSLSTGTDTIIIDRTFVDQRNCRWIIDYKTSEPAATESTDAFLLREKALYYPQLKRYRDVMQQSAPQQNIRCALYFVMLPLFCEVDVKATSHQKDLCLD